MKIRRQRLIIAFLCLCVIAAIAVIGNMTDPQNYRSGKKIAKKTFEERVEDKRNELSYAVESYSPDTIVLSDTTKERAEELAAKLGAKVRLTKSGDFATLYLPEGMTINDVYEDESYASDILEMTPDFSVRVSDVDALGRELISARPQYSVSDTYYGSQSYLDYLDLQDVWSDSKGAGVKIAVIDTGIDTDNPEFANSISSLSYNASDDKTIADYGIDEIEDEEGHGTQVAGVISAAMDGKGITGIAPEAELIVIKCDADDTGTFVRGSDLVFGLAYAIECDADVVNMSFGTSINVFAKYTKLAADSDIICVAAAGNKGSSMPEYPAADSNVIGVGSLSADGWTLSSYSNFGDNSELVAPGTVFTTMTGGEYGYSNGTSLASPITAAAVALYKSKHSHATYADVCDLLKASSTDLGSAGEDWYYGFGALDMCAFIKGEVGTITFDMQTDELDDISYKFVRGHTLQIMPEPEREDVVFDGWYMDTECDDECDYYTQIFTEDITLYAGWINEDEGTAYIYTKLSDGTVEINSYTGKRKYLTIPDTIEGMSVSSIGEGAFENNTRLRNVILPASLTSIGDRAFINCASLRSIDIPENVASIGKSAFTGCVRMTNVGIASNGKLASIGDEAFSMCGISTFSIPSRLTQLGSRVFIQSAAMRSITVSNGNSAFRVQNQALYDASGETLLYYPSGLSGQYTIADNTKSIGMAAFAFSRIEHIVLPESLEMIKADAFVNSYLREAELPANVSALGSSSFKFCQALKTVSFSENSNITEIPEASFYGCENLSTIRIPDSVKTISKNAFSCTGLRNVTFGEGSTLQIIGGEAFSCSRLKEIKIPDNVASIGDGAFFGCCAMETIEFGGNSRCASIGKTAFYGCTSLLALSFPDSLTSLGEKALYKSGIENISIGAGLTEIKDGAFSHCTKLSQITVSDNNPVYSNYDGLLYNKEKTLLITCPAARRGEIATASSTAAISGYAFSGTDKLTSVILNEGLKEIGQYAFEESGIQTPVLPTSLETIGEFAFTECHSMTSKMLIPKKVISIGRGMVYGDQQLAEIEIEADSALSRIGYGAFSGCGIQTFTVPENVSTMAQEVFSGCNNLITVTFEGDSKLSNLAAWTFWGANSLRRITFEEGSNLMLIEARACENMTSLDKIDLSECKKLKTIDNYAFYNCGSLDTVILPSGLEEVGRYAFSGCRNLDTLDLPEAVNWIGRYAFKNTNKIRLFFKASVLPTELEQNWDYHVSSYFLGVADQIEAGDWTYALTADDKASIISYNGAETNINLTTIEGHEVISIGGGAFKGNATLKSITLPNSIITICKGAFENTEALETVVLPDSLEAIDANAFKGSSVKEIILSDNSSLKMIGRHAFAQTSGLTSFKVPAGVKILSDYVFYKSSLTGLIFADNANLTTIGKYAFAGSSLSGIELPSSLELINDCAFKDAENLKTVAFGTDTRLKLCSQAFYGSGIESISIPANVYMIEELCFANCSNLTEIEVSEENEKYSSDEGLLLNKEGTTLITCPAGKTGSYTLDKSVAKLAFAAFEGSKLSTITIPDNCSLGTIGYRAFYKCENLERINISSGVQSIENYAFAYDSSLKTVNISNGSVLSGIYKSAFYNCEALQTIEIPDGVQEIGEYAYYGCSNLSSVSVSESSHLKSVSGHAFEYTKIASFTMPPELIEIGEYSFHNTNLKTIVFNDCVTDLGDYALADSPLENVEEIIIPNTVEYIGRGLLRGAGSIRKLTVPFIGSYREAEQYSGWLGLSYLFETSTENINIEEVTVTDQAIIPYRAFYRMPSLKKAVLSDSVTVISDEAFYECTNMKMDTLPAYLKSVGWEAFKGDSNVVIPSLPETLESIQTKAFEGCQAAETLIIPAKASDVSCGALSAINGLERIEVDPANKYYVSDNGILYNAAKTKILSVPSGMRGELEIPYGTEVIGGYSFSGCSNLTKVTIPESVDTVEWWAFENCTGLKSIELPETELTLGDLCFNKCTSLESMRIPKGVKSVGNQILADCTGLKELVIEADLTDIKDMMTRCSSLEHVELPEGMKTVYLQYMTSLKELILPDSVELVTLTNCDNLTYVHFGASLRDIWGWISECKKLARIDISEDNPYMVSVDGIVYSKDMKELLFAPKSISGEISLPDGVKTIRDAAFEDCDKLTGITVPDSVEGIGIYAFRNCKNLKKIRLGDGIQSIGAYAFYGTSYVDTYWTNPATQDDEAIYIGKYLIAQGSSGSTLNVKHGTRLIASQAFENDTNLGTVNLPDTVKYINSMAFWRCENLKNVELGNGVETISYDAFKETSIERIYIGKSIKEINTNAFAYCKNLKYIWVDNPDANVESGAFSTESSIEIARVPVTPGGDPFVSNCRKLIVSNADSIQGDHTYLDYLQVEAFYMESDKDDSGISDNLISQHNIHFRDDWHTVSFYVGGGLLSFDALSRGEMVQIPATAEVKNFVPFEINSLGWDINGDGKADQLPATLTEDIVAEAVFDAPVVSIQMDPEKQIEVGEALELEASCIPKEHTHTGKINWSSSDETTVKVSQTGEIEGVSEGTATVKATLAEDESIYAECSVTVIPVQYGIKLEEYEGGLNVGESMDITAKLVLPDGYSETVEWTSNDDAVAIVSDGHITARSPGSAQITAKCGGYSATYNVHVFQPISGISLNKSEIDLSVGDKEKLQVNFIPENTTDDKTTYWYTTKPGVASVDDGTITAKGPGYAEIHVIVGNMEAYCKVNVDAPIQSVILNTTTGTMRLDRTKQLEMIFTPANTTDDKTVVWTSDDPEIASVSSNGLVTALKQGKTKINGTVGSGTNNEHSASYTVTVIGLRDEATGITVTNSDDTEMAEGTTLNVSEVEEGDIAESIAGGMPGNETLEEVSAYDITLCKDGDTVQPDTTVDVEIPVPDEYNGKDVAVYRIENDNTLTDMQATVSESKYIFQTDHFSVYVLGVKHVHNLVKTAAVAATCTTDGSIEYWTCSNCGRLYSDSEGENEITAAATIVEATGHTEIATAAVDPTCTEPGLTAGTICSVCGVPLVEQQAVEPLGHDFGEWGHVADSTCTEHGYDNRTCKRCGFTETSELDLAEHEWENDYTIDVEATCTTDGSRSIHCQNCGAVKDSEVIPATNHELVKVAAAAPTCTTDGNTEYWTCTKCHKIYIDANAGYEIDAADTVVKATGHLHSDGKVTKDPTEKTEGEMTFVCSVCGETFIMQIPKLDSEQAAADEGLSKAEEKVQEAQNTANSINMNSSEQALTDAETVTTGAADAAISAEEAAAAAAEKASAEYGTDSMQAIYAQNKLTEARKNKANALIADAAVKMAVAGASTKKAEDEMAAATEAASTPDAAAVSAAKNAAAAAQEAVIKAQSAKAAADAALEAVFKAGYSTESGEYKSAASAAATAENGLTKAESDLNNATNAVSTVEEARLAREYQGVYNKKIPKIKGVKTTAKKTSIKVKWTKLSSKQQKKAKATKYEIWVCPNTKFAKADTKVYTVSKSKSYKSCTGLKKNKKYYVKVRAIKYVGGVKQVGKWSDRKKVTTKKK